MKLKLRMLAALAGVPVLVAAPLIGCSCSKKEVLDAKVQAIVDKIATLTTATTTETLSKDSIDAAAQKAITEGVKTELGDDYKINISITKTDESTGKATMDIEITAKDDTKITTVKEHVVTVTKGS